MLSCQDGCRCRRFDICPLLPTVYVLCGTSHAQLNASSLLRSVMSHFQQLGGISSSSPAGALEHFLRPPALRLQALQLLHLLLEEPSLAQAMEQSLAHAAANPQAEHTPHSTGGTAGGATEGCGGRSGEPGSKVWCHSALRILHN